MAATGSKQRLGSNYRGAGVTPSLRHRKDAEQLARFADMLTAMGTEPRLRIIRLLLCAHPDGMVVGEIQAETDIPPSTLSHHLDKLKSERLVTVTREKKFLRYSANTQTLEELLSFLFSECCKRSEAVNRDTILRICR